MSVKIFEVFRINKMNNYIIFQKISIIGVDAWKRNWKKNMKSLFIIKLLLFVNRWLTSTWTQFKYSVGRIFLRGIIPDSYWNSIIQNNSLKKR